MNISSRLPRGRFEHARLLKAWAFIVGLAACACALSWPLRDAALTPVMYDRRWVVVALTIAFGLSQLSFIRVGQRSDAEDIEFSAVVVLVASFLVGYQTLFISAFFGTLLANVFARRGLMKTAYNIAHRLFVVSLIGAVVMMTSLSVNATLGSSLFLFVTALVIFGFVEPILVSIVVYFVRGDVVRVVNTVTVAVVSLHTAVGLLAANVWRNDQGGSNYATMAIAVYVAGVAVFSRVEQRASRAEALQVFIRAIDSTLIRTELLERSLPYLSNALRANRVTIYVFARAGEAGVVSQWQRGRAVTAELLVRQHEVWPDGSSGARIIGGQRTTQAEKAWLEGLGMHHAMIVPMFDSDSIIGAVIVGDRPTSDRMFDQLDLLVLEAFTSHLGVTLERQRLHARLEHNASHDALTDLPNRTLFHQRLDPCVFNARADVSAFSVVMLDLDGFKTVNDRYGHQVGDRLLVFVAERLRDVVRPEDTVARLGGDEFAIVLPHAGEQEAQQVVQRLRQALITTVVLDGHEIEVSASAASATWGGEDQTGDDVLRRADLAMYKQKPRKQAQSA